MTTTRQTTRQRVTRSPQTGPPAAAPPNPSIGELVSQMSEQTSRLVRDEIRLAQRELQQSARHAGIGAGLFGAAGLLALFGALALVAAAIAGLALVLPVWADALVVGAVLLLAAGIAALAGRGRVKRVPPPMEDTVNSVRLDVETIKDARHDSR